MRAPVLPTAREKHGTRGENFIKHRQFSGHRASRLWRKLNNRVETHGRTPITGKVIFPSASKKFALHYFPGKLHDSFPPLFPADGTGKRFPGNRTPPRRGQTKETIPREPSAGEFRPPVPKGGPSRRAAGNCAAGVDQASSRRPGDSRNRLNPQRELLFCEHGPHG